MGLRMCSPYRPKNSAKYWVRKRVPTDLLKTVGQGEIKRSLKTTDPKEARYLAPLVCAEIDRILNDARRSQAMGSAEIEAIKGEYLRERTEAILKEAQRHQWEPEDFETATFPVEDIIDQTPPRDIDPQEYREWRAALASEWGQKAIQKTLKRHGLTPPPSIAKHLGEEIFRVELTAHSAAHAKMLGNPHWRPPAYAEANMENSETLLELFQQYAVGEKLPAKTVDSWRTYIERANRFLNGKPAAQLRRQDIHSFAEALRQEDKNSNPAGRPLTAKTVNDNYLASLSAVYKWGIHREKLTHDPTKGVRIKPRSTESPPKEGYTREQVATILRATRQQQGARTKTETANLRRWAPWLCAFTGV